MRYGAVLRCAQVVRYVALYRPLRLQQEGMELLVGYLRGLVSERAKADYDALVDGFAAAGAGGRMRGRLCCAAGQEWAAAGRGRAG